ncbi:MAG: hypothetical protein AAF961_14920 [Planctomycetota bacterium]
MAISLCTALSFFASPSLGQESVEFDILDEAPYSETFQAESPVVVDPQVQDVGYSLYPCGDCNNRPAAIKWAAGPYLRAGPSFVLGDGILDTQKTGYAVSGGVRQPFGPAIAGDRLFLDLGGSYLSAFGVTTRIVPGQEFNSQGNIVADVDVNSTLSEVRRASAHAAIGMFWGSSFDNRSEDPQLRFVLEAGGRYGHIHGQFFDQPVGQIPEGNSVFGNYSSTDTFGGLFVATEAILLRRNSVLGDLQWTVAGEFGNDWIDFRGFESGGLGTASILFGFMLSR